MLASSCSIPGSQSILGSQGLTHILVRRLAAVRPLDEPDAIGLTELPLLTVELLPLGQGILAAEEVDGHIVLNSLILDGGFQRGDVEVETLSAEPFGPVLVKCVRVALPNSLKEGELVLPLWARSVYHH